MDVFSMGALRTQNPSLASAQAAMSLAVSFPFSQIPMSTKNALANRMAESLTWKTNLNQNYKSSSPPLPLLRNRIHKLQTLSQLGKRLPSLPHGALTPLFSDLSIQAISDSGT